MELSIDEQAMEDDSVPTFPDKKLKRESELFFYDKPAKRPFKEKAKQDDLALFGL